MKLLILLALLWVVWLLMPRRWGRFWQLPLVGLAGAAILLTFTKVDLGLWGLTAFVPPDSGEPAEAIVVLGRGEAFRDSRVAAVKTLWQSDRAPRIFASGMSDAQSMIQALEADGIPSESLFGEECSQSTEENAVFTHAILRPQGIRSVILVTDPPHLLRSFLLFRSFRFHVIPHASPMPIFSSPQIQDRLELREYLGLLKYAVTGQFFPRSTASLRQPSPDVVQKLQNWQCLRMAN
ncbi:YdcF family protein [Thermocoleostomius sinensis]|jgi:uncharacterized SAM-binding protein YcdF (DUF218 family)|uniref:YdcF family protein n=1 Tax=Thermocoleostomius sinensis A174 TaxID=2016057 RepID=A0A9E9C8I4_9CYAN|nr:YdcF family protein [Thermocoleostomius sinensis]WAL58472.1 YdcF family protein [Thermocoleostomius sinensis A174]